MNYSGNMPDWHQYNSTQPIGSEVPPVAQNANHSSIFGPNISPRRLNGPTYSPEGLNKPQNEANFNHRNFQQSPNTLNRPNVPSENSPMGSAAQMSAGQGPPYGAPSSRNTMIEGTGAPLESRSIPSSSLNESIGQRNQQISINRPAASHLNCSTMNGSIGPMGQRNTPPSIQAPVPTSGRQATGSYMPCKLPCCNPDANISYESWEKFGPYPPNVPYRDSGYAVDNRRFGNEFENREQLSTAAYNMDPRRNFPDYKFRKDPIMPRTYAHPQGVIQNYPPIQNYNFPADYQKYPAYPIKEYPRETSVSNPQNPGVLKYQEQSVIVQQKYFTKQIQYQNAVIPKNIVPTTMASNVISRGQSPYFNPQLPRDFPRNYSESAPLSNRGIQTPNPIHAAYPKYQMYQQKIAIQRFSLENHLREMTRIPGYQSHPKYQEAVLRYRELLRLQQTVDYQSTVQDQPKVVTSQINEEIQPINLQFDQNGVLINSSFVSAGFSNLQSPINLQNSKNVQNSSNTEIAPLNLQHSEQFKTQSSIDNHTQDQNSSSVSQIEQVNKIEQRYCMEKDQLRLQKYENESLNVPNSDDGKTPSISQRNSKDFADKPELDVRQFLANWDESEDEEAANANLPDVVLSSSTTGVVEYENSKAVTENPEESKNCSEAEDCRGRDDCGMFENTQNEIKPTTSTDNQIYQCDLQPSEESTKSIQQDSDISESGRKPVRTGTVIQPTSVKCDNEMALDIMENLASARAVHDNVNNIDSRELRDEGGDDIIVKKESSLIEKQKITSSEELNVAHNHEAKTGMCSPMKEIIKNYEDSTSSSESGSSDDTKHDSDSNDDSSESDGSNSMDTHSLSSFIKSPKTIKGTEIHVDAQELSVIRVPPRNTSEIVDNINLQKQTSFVSEESHNPDDISLPDLPTSEYTPISTALNTPIHSDSEESSEPVIDLTTPANPIEIIQNSPMLSFTHSPIKMEPYEHLDENDLADKMPHDTLDFEFQASNSCDNDYEKLTDASSHTTEQYNITQNDEDTIDSDGIEILSVRTEQKIERNTCDLETKNDIIDNIADQNRFACNKATVMTTDEANTTVNADHQPWSSVTVSEDNNQISDINKEHQDAKAGLDKLETLSEVKDRLLIMSEGNKVHPENDQSANKWHINEYEMANKTSESTDNMTALNLVKDANKIETDSVKMSPGTTNPKDVLKSSRSCPSNSNEGEDSIQLNQSECNFSTKNEAVFTSTNHSDEYTSSSEEDEIYMETVNNPTSFTGALNIPLIPGEDFEEPKMPVLPMEGNCLTKIIKNTSPITDLDVLGSDDEKLDKMDEIWMEVGNVETVDKVTDINIDAYAECGGGSDKDRILSSGKKLRTLPKKEWKCLKNSVKPKDPSKLFAKVYNDSPEKDLENTIENDPLQHKPRSLETAKKESHPVDKDFQSATFSQEANTTAIVREKHNCNEVSIIPKSTRDSSFYEDGKQSQIMSSDNNATEILKCQEKANHINDIATKLLENARLFEPELRKTDIQRKESSCSDSARDGSKKRIKLLKEFRKIKNKINLDRPGFHSIISEDAAEKNAAPSGEVSEQCKNMEVDNVSDYNSFDTKVVSPFGEDINECAINLSKSSNDFDLLTTLSGKGCAINDSHNFYTSEHVEHEEPTEIGSGTCQSTVYSETKDDSPISPQCSCPEDSGLYAELVAKGDQIFELNRSEHQNVTEDVPERISTPTRTNLAKECNLKEDTELEILQGSTKPSDHKEPGEFLPSSKNFEDSASSCRSPTKKVDGIYESCKQSTDVFENNDVEMSTLESEQTEPPKSNGLEAVEETEDQKPANETLDLDAICNLENPQNDLDDASTDKNEELLESAPGFDDSKEDRLINNSPEEKIFNKSIENFFEDFSNISEEKVSESAKTCIETTSVPQDEKNIHKSSSAQQSPESEPQDNDDCATNIQNTLQNLESTTDIQTKSKSIENDFEIIDESSIVNESPACTELEKSTKTECSKINNLEVSSGADKNFSNIDTTFEAFGLENSFNDFDNFDVAPNLSDTADTDQSNNWKNSKAYARFEDCERYKNPDNFVSPILTSLDTLDNLNTVPVYTTKDGKITYSPNPRYTYRTLIMEAREREGYPILRDSYSGNTRAPECSNYSRNQAAFRKRKNSDTYSCSRSYGKKNYSEFYDLRERGASSMKNSSEPWNRTHSHHKKYNHQSRDRNSHQFTPHNNNTERTLSGEQISPGKVPSRYKHREESAVFDERNKIKNGTSDRMKYNTKKHYKQSTDQSTSDSTWSGSKRNLENASDTALPKPEKIQTTDKSNKSLAKTISLEKRGDITKDGNRLKDFERTEEYTSASDKNEHTTEFTINISLKNVEPSMSSDVPCVGKKILDSSAEKFESSSLKTEDKPLNSQVSFEIPKHEASEELTLKPGLFPSEWEDMCENLFVHQQSSCETKIPTEPVLNRIEEVSIEKTKMNELYDGIDDVCPSKTSSKNEETSDHTDPLDSQCIGPSSPIKSPVGIERFEDSDHTEKGLNTEKDEAIVDNVENEDISYPVPVEPIQTEEYADEQKTPELLEASNNHELMPGLNKGTENTRVEDKFEGPLHYTDDQMGLEDANNCAPEVNDVDCGNLLKSEIHTDLQNEITNSKEVSEVNVVVVESDDQITQRPEDLCSLQKSEEIEKKEAKTRSHKIRPENKNGTSVKNLQANNDSLSLRMSSEFETISNSQVQCKNYIAFSPPDESPDDTKAIPKLVIKKTDSLNCKNVCASSLATISHDAFADKTLDRDEQCLKVSVHPKIPKILIRNAKSRPSTPSIEEITEEKVFSVTTKEETKVPKVKIRFEEKRPRSPTITCNENIPRTDATENKIPKMKIKLEDRLSKVIIENINTEPCSSNEEVQKTIPKMKIKKFKDTLGQIVDTQILPVSIPRMLIYTEFENKEGRSPEFSLPDKSSNSVTPSCIQGDQRTMKDSDIKKIPKLKIKRQSSGCSIELNLKRLNASPAQSEQKKVKKSSKVAEPNDKRQSNKSSGGSEHHDSSGNIKCTNAIQSGESISGELAKSSGGNVHLTPKEIPKVIIKRASPSAEFKCELSKVKRDAIIKNKRWQPEVKLQRSWVLDCMAKDLNFDNLRLKLATPGSMLKKSLAEKEPEIGENCGKNENANTYEGEKKLFRSKSISELALTHGSFGILTTDDFNQINETDATDLPRELIVPKRCKSDLGSRFSKYSENFECKKKLKRNSHSSIIQLISKPTPNYANDSGNSLSIHSSEEVDMVVDKNQALKDSETNFNFNGIQNDNGEVHFMETSEKSQDETLGKTEIFIPKINGSPLYNDSLEKSLVDLDWNSTNTKNDSEYRLERFENENRITNSLMNDLKMDGPCRINDSHSHYSATKCKEKIEDSKDTVIVVDTNSDSAKKHTKSGKKHVTEIGNQVTEKDKMKDYKYLHTASTENLPTDLIDDEVDTRNLSSASISSDDTIDHAKTLTNNNSEVSAESLFQATSISVEPDIDILKSSDICSSAVISTANNLETAINGQIIVQQLDINDNTDNSWREAEENDDFISHDGTTEQENISISDGKALMTFVNGYIDSLDQDAQNLPSLKIDNYLNNSSENVNEDDGNSSRKYERCKDSQTIIDILSDSPSHSQGEVDIQLCPDVIEETDMCLYHEDAIPTQFELELEIMDNVVPDPLEVPMPENDQPPKEFPNCFGHEANEGSQQLSRILSNSEDGVNVDESESESTLPEEHGSQKCSIGAYRRESFAYPNKQDTTLAVDIDERNSTGNTCGKITPEFHSNVQKFSGSDLLIKEVLAAKETLRKYIGKNKYESRFKVKARPKTAAEKKQGSSFDLNTLSTSENYCTKLGNHSSSNFIPVANSSREIDRDFSSRNNNDKIVENRRKTECKINKIKSEGKHSKGSKNNLLQKEYSNLSTSIQKYTNLVQADGYSIPNHSSTDIEDRVEFSKGETTISLKNSKHLIKNHSYSNSRKKMRELMNSKDTKFRSKSSRHESNSKYIANSTIVLPNTAVQESSLEAFGQSEEKPVSDAAKHKYKSLRTLLDQNINSKTDKAKFNSYKIPKITRATDSEREISIEKPRESQRRESRMPILEPQVHLSGGMGLSDLNSDRETSRSPPLITSQENADYEATTQSLQCQLLSNEEKKALSEQRTTFLEKELPEAAPAYRKETTVADIVNDMAYHEKATIRHRRYCTLCERWFPTVTRYRRHLSGYQHRHTELTQRRTIHALFTLFTGRPCPRLQPPGVVRIDCEPGELTPLQIAVQGVTKEANKVDDGNVKKPSKEDK